MNNSYDTFTIPIGKFSIALDESGAIVATAFGGVEALKELVPALDPVRDPTATRDAREQVLEYFAGSRKEFDLKLEPAGTAFQKSVWAKLVRIPFGTTRSYREIAEELGNGNASRAVGRANGTNPICLIVPCHRVIGADGSLTGFAYGTGIKRQLLELEEALPVFGS